MATKTVGELIKEARTGAGLSQDALAKKIEGLSASDISKAERGEKELTQSQLKEIAKATGVTQKSLLDAAKAGTTATAKKTTSTTAKKTSSTTAKKTSSTTAKKTSSSSTGTSVKVTATEKKLLELYRAADADTKKAAVSLLKGETPEAGDVLSTLLGGAMDLLGNLGKKDK